MDSQRMRTYHIRHCPFDSRLPADRRRSSPLAADTDGKGEVEVEGEVEGEALELKLYKTSKKY